MPPWRFLEGTFEDIALRVRKNAGIKCFGYGVIVQALNDDGGLLFIDEARGFRNELLGVVSGREKLESRRATLE